MFYTALSTKKIHTKDEQIGFVPGERIGQRLDNLRLCTCTCENMSDHFNMTYMFQEWSNTVTQLSLSFPV